MDLTHNIREWLITYYRSLILTVFVVITGFVIYKVISRQIEKLRDQERLERHLAYSLNRIIKWIITLSVLVMILGQFGVTSAVISGFLAIIGGTVIGFAGINTLGNAFAGLIVMVSRPFGVGDRICFKGQFADVEGIELIYTKIRTLDNVLVSIPNQELLKSEIENFGRKEIVRRLVATKLGFEYDNQHVKQILLQAVNKVPGVLKNPTPYVRITNFLDNAVEYTLYVYINDVKRMREIEAYLNESVLETLKQHDIDFRTPTLLQQITD
jgi:small conductance mechanosensitive channel